MGDRNIESLGARDCSDPRFYDIDFNDAVFQGNVAERQVD